MDRAARPTSAAYSVGYSFTISRDLRRVQHIAFGLLHRARAGAVRRIVEEQSFAHRLSGAERARAEPDVHSALFRSRSRPMTMIAMERARRPFLEQRIVVAFVRHRGDELGKLMQGGVGDAFEELRLAESVADAEVDIGGEDRTGSRPRALGDGCTAARTV